MILNTIIKKLDKPQPRLSESKPTETKQNSRSISENHSKLLLLKKTGSAIKYIKKSLKDKVEEINLLNSGNTF